VEHGNKDTFKEMLRIKRTVQAQFGNDLAGLSPEVLKEATKSAENIGRFGDNEMQTLEKAENAKRKHTEAELELLSMINSNPEEIKISGEDEAPVGPVDNTEFEQLQVPQSVFERNIPGLAEDSETTSNKKEGMGALERLRKKKRTD